MIQRVVRQLLNASWRVTRGLVSFITVWRMLRSISLNFNKNVSRHSLIENESHYPPWGEAEMVIVSISCPARASRSLCLHFFAVLPRIIITQCDRLSEVRSTERGYQHCLCNIMWRHLYAIKYHDYKVLSFICLYSQSDARYAMITMLTNEVLK